MVLLPHCPGGCSRGSPLCLQSSCPARWDVWQLVTLPQREGLKYDTSQSFLSCLSRSLADRWGTTVDFTTSILHSSQFSAFRSMVFHSRSVHSLLLSSHHFLCLPLRWEDNIKERTSLEVCLLVGCLTSQQHASVSQGWICSDNFTCCHTEIEVADQTFHLTQSQYTDTGPTSPSADPITPGAWLGSHWSANF